MHYLMPLLVTVATAVMLAAACSQASPPPAPTQASAPPTKAAETTKAPAAVPTAAPTVAPAKKVAFPEKGKPITVIVPVPPGGGLDTPIRLMLPLLEKELGTPVQIVNKAGASGQLGWTDLATSKPDGYTVGAVSLPLAITVYLDTDRKLGYDFRKSVMPLAQQVWDPGAVAVRSDGPYSTIKDLVDAAKANPRSVLVGTESLLGEDHMATLQFQRLAGVEFNFVHFDGAGPANTAFLGGHVDVRFTKVGSSAPLVKSGQARLLAIMDRTENEFTPGVKTLESQGYNLYTGAARGFVHVGGTPKEIVTILTDAIRKAMADEEYKQKLQEIRFSPSYRNPEEFAAVWDEMEADLRPLFDQAKRDAAKK